MAQNWYYARGSQQFGPVIIDQLKGLISAGQVQMADLVWTDGMPQWAPAHTVAELAEHAAPLATPVSANPAGANMVGAVPVASPAWPGQQTIGQQPMGQVLPGQSPYAPGAMLGYQTPAFGQV